MNKNSAKLALTVLICLLSGVGLALAAGGISALAQWPSTLAPSNIAVNNYESADERYPRVVRSTDGNYITAWVDSRDAGTNGTDIYAQKLQSSDGARLWSATDVPVVTAAGNQPDTNVISTNNIAIAADNAGGAFIAWDDDRDYPTAVDVYIQHLDTNGALVAGWPTDGIKIEVDTSAATQFEIAPQILSDGSDGAFITWTALDNVFSGSVAYITHVAGDGTIDSDLSTAGLQAPFALPHAPGFPFDLAVSIQSDGTGGTVTAFVNADFTITSADDLYTVRLDADGNLASGWTSGVLLNSTGIENMLPTSFVLKTIPDGSGGIITAYNYQDTGDSLIYIKAQRINGSGAVQWGSGTMILNATGSSGNAPDLATDGSGGAVITWTDHRNDPETDVYAQRINSSGAVQWTTNGIAISDPGDGLAASIPESAGTYIVPDASTSGNTIISFSSDTGGGYYQIRSQKLDSSGTYLWTQYGENVSDYFDGLTGNPVLVSDGSTGAVFVWEGTSVSTYYGIFAQYLMDAPTGPTCTNMDDNTQTSSSPLTTISDQCIGITVDAGALTFENVPDSFSFPRKFRALTEQDSFSNDDPDTTTTVDVTTGPEDVITVSDFRNDGNGFTVNITASGVDSGGDSIPLENLRVLSSYPDPDDLDFDPTLNGTQTMGVEYATGSTGTQDIFTQVFTEGSLSDVNQYFIKGFSFDANADEVPDIVPLMETSTGHMLRGSLALSFYLNIPANQVAGSYSTLVTLDLQPNP